MAIHPPTFGARVALHRTPREEVAWFFNFSGDVVAGVDAACCELPADALQAGQVQFETPGEKVQIGPLDV